MSRRPAGAAGSGKGSQRAVPEGGAALAEGDLAGAEPAGKLGDGRGHALPGLRGVVGLGVDRVHRQPSRPPAVDRVDAADEPLAVQDRQDVVAELAPGRRLVDLEPEAEAEQLLGASAVGDQAVEGRQQRRAAGERPLRAERVGVCEPLAAQARDPDGYGDPVADEPAQLPLPAGRAAVQGEAELVRARHAAGPELALEQTAGHLPRRAARLGQRIAPLGQLPDPLAAVTAHDGDAAHGGAAPPRRSGGTRRCRPATVGCSAPACSRRAGSSASSRGAGRSRAWARSRRSTRTARRPGRARGPAPRRRSGPAGSTAPAARTAPPRWSGPSAARPGAQPPPAATGAAAPRGAARSRPPAAPPIGTAPASPATGTLPSCGTVAGRPVSQAGGTGPVGGQSLGLTALHTTPTQTAVR